MGTLCQLSQLLLYLDFGGLRILWKQAKSGKKYGLEFFTAAGMSLCMLMKVVKTTGRIQQLKPDNEELSLLASIGKIFIYSVKDS